MRAGGLCIMVLRHRAAMILAVGQVVGGAAPGIEEQHAFAGFAIEQLAGERKAFDPRNMLSCAKPWACASRARPVQIIGFHHSRACSSYVAILPTDRRAGIDDPDPACRGG